MDMETLRIDKLLVSVLLLLSVSACSNIEPWVKPYERDRLADPIMFLDANPVSTAYIHHVAAGFILLNFMLETA
jgi:hypothetical protein